MGIVTVTIPDEQILEAVHIVFVRDGINATTRDIARQAGVGEGSLFRRFPTKEALFTAAILTPPPPAWVRELETLVGQGDLRANLIHVTRGIIQFAQEGLPLVMVEWAQSRAYLCFRPFH
ncbi:MAG: helix-turn-helix transcriptional regulator [Chthonomonadaceae bacterium]|nr:helix-turn-helix transcriptional regulator [Chthonomonadaceae bacterium]